MKYHFALVQIRLHYNATTIKHPICASPSHSERASALMRLCLAQTKSMTYKMILLATVGLTVHLQVLRDCTDRKHCYSWFSGSIEVAAGGLSTGRSGETGSRFRVQPRPSSIGWVPYGALRGFCLSYDSNRRFPHIQARFDCGRMSLVLSLQNRTGSSLRGWVVWRNPAAHCSEWKSPKTATPVWSMLVR